jgi:hypothetical protein
VFIFDGADELSGTADQVDRLHVSWKFNIRIDVNKPGRTKADHALIALREEFSSGFVVEPIGFEMTVDSPPVDSANDFPIADSAGWADRLIAAESAF